VTSGAGQALLAGEEWILSPGSALGRLVLGLCAAAGFQPTVVASVDDVATAVALVAVGWGITIAPELTPIGPGQAVTHIPLTDVDARRHSVLVVRDGEHESPEIATVVAAVRRVSARHRTSAE
jgi:DNA-binding transcriptional LysR family regulator